MFGVVFVAEGLIEIVVAFLHLEDWMMRVYLDGYRVRNGRILMRTIA